MRTHPQAQRLRRRNLPGDLGHRRPEIVAVQGAALIDPEARADLGSIPAHEQVVLLPRAFLESYGRSRRDDPALLARADLGACFDLFERSAFRLETLRAYAVGAEDERLRAFRLGLPRPERSVRTSPVAGSHRADHGGREVLAPRASGRPARSPSTSAIR